MQSEPAPSGLLGSWTAALLPLVRQLSLDAAEIPNAFLERDPAARRRAEVVLLYPGFRAVLLHRVAHALWHEGHSFFARTVSEFGRSLTGIEIHPAASLGRRIVIDHGFGVVIGETAVVGDDVTIYQGVTLGGTRNTRNKRHPTLGRGVVVGVGAAVLGNISIGEGARIGAGAVVLADVEPGMSVGGIPAAPLHTSKNGRATEITTEITTGSTTGTEVKPRNKKGTSHAR